MARQPNVGVDNNFSQGLVTQGTGLNFPPNSCTETFNCVFSERGPVTRRLGFDFEDGFELKTIDRTNSVVNTFTWRNVSGDGSINLYVVQIGETLHFYNILANGTVSDGVIATTIDLTDFMPPAAPSPKLNECHFSSGLGYLFVTHPTLNPFYVSYDVGTEVATATQIDIFIRDTTGVEDNLDIDERPATLTDEHNYNLRNQGWDQSKISLWDSTVGSFPSNADVWWIYRDSSNNFDPTLEGNFSRGTAQAPKGKFILNAFSQDRSTVSGVAGIDTVTTSFNRPSVSAFFAGRLFYAGVRYTGFDSKIFFSQIIEDISQAGKCYQTADPSSESLFELNASDGGVINIPGSGVIHKIVAQGSNLVVFAANGVWVITGNTGIGFTSLDYAVSFVSTVRTVSATSFVEIEGNIAWWNNDGINILTGVGSSTSDRPSIAVSSLTDSKIKSFYSDIPLQTKIYARGNYNPKNKVVTWLYNLHTVGTLDERYNFDRMLNFNVLSGAFYPWTYDDTNVQIHAISTMEGVGSVITEELVVDNLDVQVVDQFGENVGVIEFSASLIPTVDKFLVSYPEGGSYKVTFAEANDDGFLDFFTFDDTGLSYDSYFITGYKVDTQGQRKFQSNYLYTFSDNSVATSFDVQSIWNYASSGNSGKWSSVQRVTNILQNYGIVRNRLKIRGEGYSLQFKFSSVPGEAFNLHGWTFYETANAGI